jgi:hypothetical protein
MVLLFTTAALVVVLLGALAATAFSSAGVGKGLVGSNGGAAEGGPSPLEQVRGLAIVVSATHKILEAKLYLRLAIV